MIVPIKPSRAEIQAAYGKTVPDVIAPNLKVLFCGINASLYSAVVGHHFARPGNRFWKALYGAGFTDRLLSPFEDEELLRRGYGVTNIVDRATARADELDPAELLAGRDALAAKISQYQPQWLAVLGISAYRVAFQEKKAVIGPQKTTLGDTKIWVLPNPSGLNAHYQIPALQQVYRELLEGLQTSA
ncbi:MAG: G/U mismatch-specific DNA glycosylase [Cyanobacteria bacterium Co-bin8]|nr:G/U mismatch-specific DNA glycosylase [Cyanobacteria bacterium Co-bin8]